MSRIDIAVTCYNYGRFLRQSVESILNQSHAQCRVLIIDDASGDETPAVSAALAREDKRVQLLRHPVNLGHIATYNEAIHLAEGDYLLLLSADDFLLPGALARAVAVLDRESEVGLLIGQSIRNESGKSDGQAAPTRNVGLLDPAGFIWDLVLENRVATATAIVRTTVQKQLGGYLAELPHSGDLEMWLRFALQSRIACLDAVQAVYRRHEANMSHAYSGLGDFEQRRAAIARHLGQIRALQGKGPSLERRIRLRLLRLSLFWAAYAVREGQLTRASSLLASAVPLLRAARPLKDRMQSHAH